VTPIDFARFIVISCEPRGTECESRTTPRSTMYALVAPAPTSMIMVAVGSFGSMTERIVENISISKNEALSCASSTTRESASIVSLWMATIITSVWSRRAASASSASGFGILNQSRVTCDIGTGMYLRASIGTIVLRRSSS
jgi:hypothetical protein